MQGHESITKGGWLGHYVRRAVHVGMIFLPWIYYTFHISAIVIEILLVLVILVETVRLKLGLQLFGQRSHEAKRISSFAWGAASLFLVLLFADRQFAYPIIASCAFADPFVGELRRFHFPPWLIAATGVVLVGGLWLLASLWLGTAWWWALIMGPLIIASEWPNLKWIDDNAMMQLVPLLVVVWW